MTVSKNNTPLIQTQGLKKYFKTRRGMLHAVDDVNITINQGQTFGVVGESGCGKSTLGRTIIRLIEATDGQVLYQGEDIMQMGRQEMKTTRMKLQMIFQDPFTSLNPRLSIGEIIAEPMKVTKIVRGKAALQERTKELMDMCGLPQRYYNAYPHELDGGRRQRVGLARALAVDPSFIVCDEPVSALDVSIQAQILNLMMDLQEQHGLTYMFSPTTCVWSSTSAMSSLSCTWARWWNTPPGTSCLPTGSIPTPRRCSPPSRCPT